MRCVLLVLVVLVSLVLGKWLFDDAKAVSLYASLGYWFITVNFACFLLCLPWRRMLSATRPQVMFGRSALLGLVAVLGSVFYVTSFESLGFKTVMDEHVIAATAQGLHLEGKATAAMRVHYEGDQFILSNEEVDKRPIFFPYLVSLVHDALGYDPHNSIRLNAYVLCPVLFALLYVLGCRIGGIASGIFLCVSMATIPLCSFIFLGGGLELLNLVLLVSLALLVMDFWSKPDARSCAALCFAATLLAQTRYESVIFIVPVALLIGLRWLRIKRVEVTWPLLLAPVFLIPYLWQHCIFSLNEAHWQLGQKQQPFGLDYLPDNFVRSVHYFFNFDATVPNAWLLAGGALAAVAYLLWEMANRREEIRRLIATPWFALIVLMLGFVGLYGLLLGYSWEFGSAVVQRLCLPLYLLMAILIVGAIASCRVYQRPLFIIIFGALSLYVVGYAYPVSSDRRFDMGLGWQEFQLIEAMFDSGDLDSSAVYISENPSFFSVHRYSILSNYLANANKDGVAQYIANTGSRPVYVLTRHAQMGNGELVQQSFNRLDSEFELELFREYWVTESNAVRFSRVVGVSAGDAADRQSDLTSQD